MAENSAGITDGYQQAFYAVAELLGITDAQPLSPKRVWEAQMLPRLRDMAARAAWSPTDDTLRSIIHYATHQALPFADDRDAGVTARARTQVRIADFIIGAIRAREHGADHFGDLYFHDDRPVAPAQRKPDYEFAWRELHDALQWMQGHKALNRYLGWNFAKIANDLIDHAYPGLREGASLDLPVAARRFWLIVHEPGTVPERKGSWPVTDTAEVLREFIAARPTAYLHVLTVAPDGSPDVQHGPEVLQMLDGRSMSVGRKHNVRTLAAHTAPATPGEGPSAEEWDEKLTELYGWTASAWLSGEDDDGDRRSELRVWLCGLIGWFMGAMEAAPTATPEASDPATVEPVTVEQAREKAEVHFSPDGFGSLGIEGYVRALRDFGLIATDPRQHAGEA